MSKGRGYFGSQLKGTGHDGREFMAAGTRGSWSQCFQSKQNNEFLCQVHFLLELIP